LGRRGPPLSVASNSEPSGLVIETRNPSCHKRAPIFMAACIVAASAQNPAMRLSVDNANTRYTTINPPAIQCAGGCRIDRESDHIRISPWQDEGEHIFDFRCGEPATLPAILQGSPPLAASRSASHPVGSRRRPQSPLPLSRGPDNELNAKENLWDEIREKIFKRSQVRSRPPEAGGGDAVHPAQPRAGEMDRQLSRHRQI
jgi:hypothetical protein